jgi:hypothetical protein
MTDEELLIYRLQNSLREMIQLARNPKPVVAARMGQSAPELRQITEAEMVLVQAAGRWPFTPPPPPVAQIAEDPEWAPPPAAS